jgi:hypothetical protein
VFDSNFGGLERLEVVSGWQVTRGREEKAKDKQPFRLLLLSCGGSSTLCKDCFLLLLLLL